MGGNAFTSFPVSGAVGGWVELGRTTLGSAGDNIEVSGLADKRYYQVLVNTIASGNTNDRIRLGSGSVDSGSNYAKRSSSNGAADSTVASTNTMQQNSTTASVNQRFSNYYLSNLSSKEKLGTGHVNESTTTGAGTAPNRVETVGKWVITSNPLDTFACQNTETGDFAIGSEVVVLGWDPADVHTTNFWEELFSEQLVSDNQNFSTGTITAKKYLWLQFYQVGMTGNAAWRFNGDSTTSYARRHEINGSADATVVSQTSLLNVLTGGTGDAQTFTNAFIINNSANEKLIIFSTVFGATGAATAPQRIQGVCKWDDVAAQITSMTVDDSGAGFDTGSFLKIWGSN